MPKKPLPQFVAPMMASNAKKPFDDPDWIFEAIVTDLLKNDWGDPIQE